MSFEELRDQGVILPEEEWGRRSLEPSVSRVATGVALVGSAAAIGVAWFANGGWLTWVATAAYIAFFLGLSVVFHRAAGSRRAQDRLTDGSARQSGAA